MKLTQGTKCEKFPLSPIWDRIRWRMTRSCQWNGIKNGCEIFISKAFVWKIFFQKYPQYDDFLKYVLEHWNRKIRSLIHLLIFCCFKIETCQIHSLHIFFAHICLFPSFNTVHWCRFKHQMTHENLLLSSKLSPWRKLKENWWLERRIEMKEKITYLTVLENLNFDEFKKF